MTFFKNGYQKFDNFIEPDRLDVFANSLNGKFVATKDKSPFILRVVNNELRIHYTVNKRTFTERIEMASKNTLVISNTDGFKYTYKRFEKLKMDI